MISIAVLLTVHNRRDKTLQCLQNLFAQTLANDNVLDVYMVDDGSIDDTEQAVKEQFSRVNIIHGDGNLFWNRGMHLAWETAAKTKKYDYYLWLNDDVELYDFFFNTLLSCSQTYSDKCIIVGPTESIDKRDMTYGGLTWFNQRINPENRVKEVQYFNGNIVLIPNYVYQKLGNLDPYYSHSKGDFDYGFRARKANIKIYQTSIFLGKCNRHEKLPAWANPQIPLQQRLESLFSPLGQPPWETFYFEKKHIGFFPAIFHFFTVILRAIFPSIWVRLNKSPL